MRLATFLLGLLLASSARAQVYQHVATIGSPGAGPGQMDHPFDVAILAGRLYVGDSNNNRVQVFGLDGTLLFEFGGTGTGDGQFRRNRGIGATPFVGVGEAIFVTDAKNDRVQRFDRDGNHEVSWGSIGAADDQFFRPRGVAVAPDGTVVVCDADNHRIKIHEADLSLRAILGELGSAEGEFQSPVDCAVSPGGMLHVVDTFNQRVQVFDLQGDFQFAYGSAGLGPGQFLRPKAIEIGGDGRVFVADTRDEANTVERVHCFDAAGNFLTRFGSWGSGSGQMRMPSGLAVDADGRVYVADAENGRVTVWAIAGVGVESTSMSRLKGSFAP